MHVILDSNIYLADGALKGASFATFFDLVRKSRSTLVLPELVEEEAVGVYRRKLEELGKDLERTWNKYQHLSASADRATASFTSAQVEHWTKEFRTRIRSAGAPVQRLFPLTPANISLKEVFARGVSRQRPASGAGEELRDVVIWFATLDYAQSVDEPVAFVSADVGYWDGDKIHPGILNDVSKSNRRVKLFNSLDRFNSSFGPRRTLSESESQAVITQLLEQLTPALVALLSRPLDPTKLPWLRQWNTIAPPSLENVQVVQVLPTSATLHEVDPDEGIEFAEIGLTVTFKATRVQEPTAAFPFTASGGMGSIYHAPVTPLYPARQQHPPLSSVLNYSGFPFSQSLSGIAIARIVVRMKSGVPIQFDIEDFNIAETSYDAFTTVMQTPTFTKSRIVKEAKLSPIGSKSPAARRKRKERKGRKRP